MSDADAFKDVKRTPRARDGDLQEGRPHPALRVYGARYEAVSPEVASERLLARKKGEIPIIKGGLDDNDPSLEIKDVGLPGPYEPSRLNNKPRHGGQDKPATPTGGGSSPAVAPPGPAVPAPDPSAKPAGVPGGGSAESVMMSLLSSPPGSVESMVDIEDDPLYGIEDRPPPRVGAPSPDPEKEHLSGALRKASETIAALQAEKSRKSPAEEYSSGRVRVEVATDSMTFSVSAVDCIRGASGVVLLLPTSGDSMTFIPSPGSRAVLSCHERSSVDECVFTGVSFPIQAIGVLGLVFQRASWRPAEAPGPAETDQVQPKPRPRRQEQRREPPAGSSVLDAMKWADEVLPAGRT